MGWILTLLETLAATAAPLPQTARYRRERGSVTIEHVLWAVAVIAILVVAAPWMLGFTAMAIMAWNAVLCGIVLAVAALWEHLVPHQGGHA